MYYAGSPFRRWTIVVKWSLKYILYCIAVQYSVLYSRTVFENIQRFYSHMTYLYGVDWSGTDEDEFIKNYIYILYCRFRSNRVLRWYSSFWKLQVFCRILTGSMWNRLSDPVNLDIFLKTQTLLVFLTNLKFPRPNSMN